MKSNRLEFLDASKGLGIIFVMLGHIMTESNPLTWYLATFKITIFFIISGMLIAYKDYQTLDLKVMIKKLFKSLIIPYILFSLIVTVFDFAVNILRGREFTAILIEDITMSITFRGVSTLWFLPCLFFGKIIFFIAYRNKIAKIILSICPIFIMLLAGMITIGDDVVSCIILSVTKALLAGWFIFVGYLVYRLNSKIKIDAHKIITGIIFSVLNLILCMFNPGVDFNYIKFGNIPPLFFITGIIGAIGCIMVFEYMLVINSRFLVYCGKNSLIIMLTHYPFLFIPIITRIINLIYRHNINYYLECFIILLILILVEIFIVEFVNKYIPEIVGIKRKINKTLTLRDEN